MNTKKIGLNLMVAGLTVLPFISLAATIPGEPTAGSYSVGGIVSAIIDKVWVVFAGIALILFIWAGVRFLTAGGDPEKIQEARQAALWGVVGVVVMVLAFSIFSIANNILAGGVS